MLRRNFIKNAMISSAALSGLGLQSITNTVSENSIFGNWNIKEVDYLFNGFERGRFYLVYFSTFMNAEEFNRLHSLDGKYYNMDIYYYINKCITKYANQLISGHNDIRFIKYSQKCSYLNMLYHNDDNIFDPSKYYEERIKIQASRYKKILKQKETLVYIFDYCEYKWIEPYEFRYMFREQEEIPMYIVNFTFKDFWCIQKESAVTPYLIIKVSICTPEFLGFVTEIKYNILNERFE